MLYLCCAGKIHVGISVEAEIWLMLLLSGKSPIASDERMNDTQIRVYSTA